MTEKLGDTCRNAAAAARRATIWFDDNAQRLGGRHASLRRSFRNYERELNKLMAAAARPSSVGIFGPSQVGKSYLVSALTTEQGQPLITEIGDREVNFLKEINPVGGGNEATGVVTRFTIQKEETPPGKPVAVRLLTQVDLIKIIVNTFMLDIDPAIEKAPSEDEVVKALDAAEKAKTAQPTDDLTDLDINDFREYFRTNFPTRETARVLERVDYWERMENIAPYLEVEERLKLYAFMWGNIPQFNDLFRRLYSGLAQLGFPDKAWCGAEALIPREESIIDVERLHKLMDDDAGSLEVVTASGRSANIPRSVLTALVAELVITLPRVPWDFLKHTDILDFPGARSRYKISNLDEYFSKNEAIGKLLLRGKVAYLFERYRTEFDLSTLLLCIKPGNQEVRTLSELVNPWIHKTQGRDPKERAESVTTLFFISTQFDRHFERSGGSDGSTDENWTKLIRESLISLFGDNDKWVEEWTPGQPFNNVFFGRSPTMETTLMRYEKNEDGSRVEVGLADPEFVERVRKEFLANELIKRHVAEPEKAWDAALSLNDGGGTYIAEKLSGVCRPDLKDNQIRARLTQIVSEMTRTLRDFHVSEDGEEERKKRIDAATRSLLELAAVLADQKFGHLLDFMNIDASSILRLMRRYSAGMEENAETPPVGVTHNKDATRKEVAALLGLDDAIDTREQGNGADFHARMAEAILRYWYKRLEDLAHNERIMAFLNVPAEVLETIIRELQAGAERLGLSNKIAEMSRKYSNTIDKSKYEHYKTSNMVAKMLNDYVLSAGQLLKPENERLRRKDGAEVLFASEEWIDDIDDFNLSDSHPMRQLFFDWIVAFKALVEENISAGRIPGYDQEQNAILGDIIADLRKNG